MTTKKRANPLRGPLGYVLACAVGVCVGWAGERITRALFPIRGAMAPVQSIQAEGDAARFSSICAAMRAIIAEHDGWIPPDPYMALVSSGKVESFQDLVNARIQFLMEDLPPRIQSVPSQNAKGILFVADMSYLGEVWIYHLDGTWSRHSDHEASGLIESWHEKFRRAGFPHWSSLKDRAAWIETHKNALVWDPNAKLYVVSPAASGS